MNLLNEQLDTQKLRDLDSKFVLHNNHDKKREKEGVIFVQGKNASLWDTDGNEYIDAQAGLMCVHLGHGREDIAQVANRQMSNLEYFPTSNASNNFSSLPSIRLAEKLVNLAKESGFVNMRSVFFCSGGSEANESAVHLIYRYWELQNKRQKKKILCFKNAYHGGTFIASSVSERVHSYGFERVLLSPDEEKIVVKLDYPHQSTFDPSLIRPEETVSEAASRTLQETIDREGAENIALIIFEPLQGEGGILVPEVDYILRMQRICRAQEIMLLADEVLTFGKTGTWFCLARFGIEPDVITIAKGLSSGYVQLGAMIATNRIKQVVEREQWTHSFTYSGHPTACCVALKVLEIYENENSNERARQIGREMISLLKVKLSGMEKIVQDIRGMGILIGVQLRKHIGMEVARKLLSEHRILVHTMGQHKEVLSMVLPLSITQEQMDKIGSSIQQVLKESGG